MIHAIIVDHDLTPYTAIKQHSAVSEIVKVLGEFTQPAKALQFLETNYIDLAFVNADLPDIDISYFTQTVVNKPYIVYITKNKERAIEAFHHGAVGFLLKPFNKPEVEICVSHIRNLINKNKVDVGNQQLVHHTYLKSNSELLKVNFEDVYYIESKDDYIKIFFKNQHLLILSTLKSIIEKFPQDQFIRIHRSYIISINKIERFSKNKVVILGKELPVGISYAQKYWQIMGFIA